MRHPERLFHITDGPDRFPHSCVVFVDFGNWEQAQLFAKLREEEDVLIRDVPSDVKSKREYTEIKENIRKNHPELWASLRLEWVQDQLIWLATNLGRDTKRKKRKSNLRAVKGSQLDFNFKDTQG